MTKREKTQIDRDQKIRQDIVAGRPVKIETMAEALKTAGESPARRRVKITVSYVYELELDDFDGNQEDLDEFTAQEIREDAWEMLRDEGPRGFDVTVEFEDGTTEQLD